jgi:Flp pilus assembly protein TadB
MAALFAVAVLGVLVVLVALRAMALRRRRAVSRRLDMLREREGGGTAGAGPGGGLLGGAARGVLRPWMALGEALRSAHAPSPAAFGVVGASGLFGMGYAGWIADQSGALWGLVGGTALAALTWLIGGSVLEGAARRRRTRISRALSDWVDTVTCYLHAGMPFESAVGMAIRARIATGKDLKDEWFRYLQDTRLGTSRNEALVSLARRCDSEDLHRVIGAVMAASDDREGLARNLHACALDLQASSRSRQRSRLGWRALAVLGTGVGMAIAIGLF